MLWAFLSQVLRDGKEAACQAAVASIAVARLERGEEPPSEDTGDSCRARAKLAPQALKAISCEVAEELEQAADPGWLWKGTHHAKLVDGFTFTMPDTPANQQQYPQAKTQQPGIGLPIARATAIMSLATGAIMNLACGPYQGKQTGETALLRCKTPKMVEAEVWATILAYNLIRTTGRRRGGAPRQAAAADQLHCGLPIHPLRMDAALRQPDTCGHLAGTSPPATRADRGVPGRQPAWTVRTTRHQTPKAPLPADETTQSRAPSRHRNPQGLNELRSRQCHSLLTPFGRRISPAEGSTIKHAGSPSD